MFFFGFIKKLFFENENGGGEGSTDYLSLVVVLAVFLLILGASGDLLKKALAPTIGLENGIALIVLIIILLLLYAARKAT